MTNGATLSHPAAVGSVLGVFTVLAMAASFATVAYGINVPAMRTHYAHSLSVLVIIEVFQSIFFSGTLSLNWPSVCAAWWSNFAWSAGMIHSPHIENTINRFIGQNLGNDSQVGAAGSSAINNNGGQQAQQIYGRSLDKLYYHSYDAMKRGEDFAHRLSRRASPSNSTGLGYDWSGGPVRQGLPIPGNWSGFAGELSEVGIAASDAFMTGFLWFLVLLACLIAATLLFKGILEGMSAIKWIQHDRLAMFRSHWLGFLGLIVLRAMLIAFFMFMTLTMFQFSFGGAAGVTAIAAIVFIIFFVGVLGIAGYACFYRLRFGHYASAPDRIHYQTGRGLVWGSEVQEQDRPRTFAAGLPLFRVRYHDKDAERQTVHEDANYNKRFGWLSARFRRTRWWFFTAWIVYQFVRACFVGGARASPVTQVFGVLVVELLAFIAIVIINPFESARNTALAVYMLSISKVVTAGLSIAFLPQFNLARIPATVVGFIIIITQAFVVIGLLILVVIGVFSTYFSLTRNREEFHPQSWEGLRINYYEHLEMKATDLPPPPPIVPEEPKEPYFNVNEVRRAPKIEDEDEEDAVNDMDPVASQFSVVGGRTRASSRANSMMSQTSNVPYGARIHRASWSSRDFSQWQEQDGMSGSHVRKPSRTVSGSYTSNSMVPLVRPQISQSSLRRSATPKATEK